MAGYLIDTNHMREAVMPVSRIRDRIAQMRRQGVRCGICVPVLCEIEVGIQQLRRPERYRRSLTRLLDLLSVWPMKPSVATIYGELHWRAASTPGTNALHGRSHAGGAGAP